MNFQTLEGMSAGRSAYIADEILLHGPSSFVLPAPIAVASDSDEHELQAFWAFELARRCAFPAIRLICLANVYVSPEGLVFFPNGDCLLETIYPWEKTNLPERFPRMANTEAWQAAELASAQEVDEAVHLREPGEAGYFHWINSVLPRAAALQRFLGSASFPWPSMRVSVLRPSP